MTLCPVTLLPPLQWPQPDLGIWNSSTSNMPIRWNEICDLPSSFLIPPKPASRPHWHLVPRHLVPFPSLTGQPSCTRLPSTPNASPHPQIPKCLALSPSNQSPSPGDASPGPLSGWLGAPCTTSGQCPGPLLMVALPKVHHSPHSTAHRDGLASPSRGNVAINQKSPYFLIFL